MGEFGQVITRPNTPNFTLNCVTSKTIDCLAKNTSDPSNEDGWRKKFAGTTFLHVEAAGGSHPHETLLDRIDARVTRVVATPAAAMMDEFISKLGYYPNPLHPDPQYREIVIDHLKKVIRAAGLLQVPVVGTFVGRDKTKTLD